MNRNELRKADINLMVVFETLMLERSVTRVAEKLFLGQPTISSALNRLRTMFNDPLSIRVGHRMELTARAEELIQYLSPALDSLSVALSLTRDFHPASSTMTFRMGLSDDVEFGLLRWRRPGEQDNSVIYVRPLHQPQGATSCLTCTWNTPRTCPT